MTHSAEFPALRVLPSDIIILIIPIPPTIGLSGTTPLPVDCSKYSDICPLFFVVCFITKSFLTKSFLTYSFLPTPALSTICGPLSNYLCSITPETARADRSYSHTACEVQVSAADYQTVPTVANSYSCQCIIPQSSHLLDCRHWGCWWYMSAYNYENLHLNSEPGISCTGLAWLGSSSVSLMPGPYPIKTYKHVFVPINSARLAFVPSASPSKAGLYCML